MQSRITSTSSHLLSSRHECNRALVGRPFTSRPCSRGHLQVVAAKGKGKKRAQQQFQQQQAGGGPQGPPTPDVDLENVEFVIFIRAKKLPQWYPLSIVKAGAAANGLVRGLNTEWGKRLFGRTLVRNIAKSVYRDRRNIEKSFKAQAPPMKNMTEFEYAFNIRDKTDPKNWYKAENLTILPPQDKLGPDSFLEGLREKIRGPGK